MTELRIATRGSLLARAQAQGVAEALSAADSSLRVRLVIVTTSGDRDRTSPVTTLTETGAFVRAVQATVLAGEADLAVHSCKDLPVEGPAGLEVWYPRRESPWDVLVGASLDGLAPSAVIGTGSPRRTSQLRLLRPDLHIRGIRGNVDTRLAAVESGAVAGVVLAEAGLRRLGRDRAVAQRFTLEEMVPAPGQGTLAVEAPPGSPAAERLADLEDTATRHAVEAERMLLARTGAGCRSALGAYAEDRGGVITMTGFVSDGDGPRRARVRAGTPTDAAAALADELGL